MKPSCSQQSSTVGIMLREVMCGENGFFQGKHIFHSFKKKLTLNYDCPTGSLNDMQGNRNFFHFDDVLVVINCQIHSAKHLVMVLFTLIEDFITEEQGTQDMQSEPCFR